MKRLIFALFTFSAVLSLDAFVTPKPLFACEFTCATGGTCPKFLGLPKPRCINGCCVY